MILSVELGGVVQDIGICIGESRAIQLSVCMDMLSAVLLAIQCVRSRSGSERHANGQLVLV